MVYSVLDSATAKKMFHVRMAYGDTAQTPTRLFLNVDSIATVKNLYQKDSIVFRSQDNPRYLSLVDSCLLANAPQFDKKKPEDIVHVGGVFYRFVFEKTGAPTNVLNVVSPTRLDYSFLARLVTETFGLYKRTGRQLLNKANTNGKYHN